MVLGALGLVWTGLATGLVPDVAGRTVDTVVLLSATILLGGPAASRALSSAVGNLVVELGPTSRPTSPVSATLAGALADPYLQVRAIDPETGWTDELGRPTGDPVTAAPGRVTVAVDPEGGQVTLVHTEPGAADSPLARAAASAALLAPESVRLEVGVRREAAAVRESTARLLTVGRRASLLTCRADYRAEYSQR